MQIIIYDGRRVDVVIEEKRNLTFHAEMFKPESKR